MDPKYWNQANIPLPDECSNDSIFLTNSTQTTSEPPYNNKKRSRRQSSNGSNYSNQTTKSSTKRRSKDSVTSDSGLGSQHGGGLDRLVDTNIDPMFLDCLEDELPSVTFDDKPADPTELVHTYENCTSINLF